MLVLLHTNQRLIYNRVLGRVTVSFLYFILNVICGL